MRAAAVWAMFLLMALPRAAADQDDADALNARLKEMRERAQKRLDQAKQDLEDESRAAREAAEGLRKRLADKPLTLKRRAGLPLPSAVIREYSITDVGVECAGKTVTLPWDTVAPESLLAAADILFDAGAAEAQFERGRFLIARRLFAEAKEALRAAVKLNDDFQFQVEEISEMLDRVIAGRGAFHGGVKRTGKNAIELTYDLKDEEQLEDFAGGFKLQNGSVVLRETGRAAAYLRAEFAGQLDIQLKLTADTPFTVAIIRQSEQRVWQIEFRLDGIALSRLDAVQDDYFKRGALVVKSDRARLTKDKSHDVLISIKDHKLSVSLDRKEALSQQDPAIDAGIVAFSIDKGRAALAAPLVFRGTMNPRELEKQFAEAEILVRRAVDPDLKDVELSRESSIAQYLMRDTEQITFTADHPYFLKHLVKELGRYDELKRSVRKFLSESRGDDRFVAELDELIRLYPQVPSLFYLRALFRASQEDNQGALQDLQESLRLFPQFAEALTLQARMQDREFEFEAAVATATKAIQAMPDGDEAYVVRAESGYACDPAKIEQWIQDLRIARKLEPTNREAGISLRALRYQARGPRDLGCRFDAESAHYFVTTDISAEASRAYADRLEAAFKYYADTFKKAYREKPFRKPRVAIFNTEENYRTYYELLSETRRESAVGLFHPHYNELLLFEMTDADQTHQVLYHEAFHHFMTLLVKRNPPYWYNEGIAEYMSGITVKDNKVVEKARIQKERLAMLQPLASIGIALPFEEIMRETPGRFYSGATLLKYAQAWSMVHFFYEYEKGKHRGMIEKYFDEVRAGRTINEAFDAVFEDSAQDLQKEWLAYVKGLK